MPQSDWGRPRVSWWAAALLSAALYGIWGFLSHVSSTELGARWALFYQAVGGLAVALGLLLWGSGTGLGADLARSGRGLGAALAVGVLGMAATYLFLVALEHGQVSIVNTIVALSPVVTIGLAVVLLRETLSPLQWVGVLLGLLSVLLLVRG